jgi:hypothetical protein
MGSGGGGSPTASSSSDDDGDATWKAAIESVAVGGFGYPSSNGAAKAGGEDNHGSEQPPQEEKAQAPGLKLYQIKVYRFPHWPLLLCLLVILGAKHTFCS